MSNLKTYRVYFTNSHYLRVFVEAETKDDAIALAEKMYADNGAENPCFQHIDGDDFCGAWAEEDCA